MGEQLVDVLRCFDSLFLIAEQVVVVPQIFVHDMPPRTSVREPQLAQQLVEVPTILYFLKLPISEQIVDFPVPGGVGRLTGLAPTVAQIVDNPAPDGGLQGFRPGQSSSASSSSPAGVHENADEHGEWVFRTFPRPKKVRRSTGTRVRVLRSVSSSELSAQAMTVEVPQIQFLDDGMVGYCWAWCLVRHPHIFYVMVFSDPDVDAVPSMLQLLPQLVTLGNWTQRPRASRTWQFLVRCLGVLFMAQCLVQQWVHAMR